MYFLLEIDLEYIVSLVKTTTLTSMRNKIQRRKDELIKHPMNNVYFLFLFGICICLCKKLLCTLQKCCFLVELHKKQRHRHISIVLTAAQGLG